MGWHDAGRTGKRGAPRTYSDIAIRWMAMLAAVYRLTLRMTPGLRGLGHAIAQGCAGGAALSGLVPAAPDTGSQSASAGEK